MRTSSSATSLSPGGAQAISSVRLPTRSCTPRDNSVEPVGLSPRDPDSSAVADASSCFNHCCNSNKHRSRSPPLLRRVEMATTKAALAVPTARSGCESNESSLAAATAAATSPRAAPQIASGAQRTNAPLPLLFLFCSLARSFIISAGKGRWNAARQARSPRNGNDFPHLPYFKARSSIETVSPDSAKLSATQTMSSVLPVT
mmetsp:Transcript_105684/g.297262  ORF Transcript_105684/g.297262 Transcript_105684/m.297262 type:complete len:202 (+) Transcript_105684:472-1077(+)